LLLFSDVDAFLGEYGEQSQMVVGFNHNFRYKGEVYHIQTEDSGVRSPNIVTLLYQGGTILASKKTSYADIARVDNLDQVVEELMKEQHKGMLRDLKAGEFDEVIDRFQSGSKVTPKVLEREKVSASPAAEKPVVAEQRPAPAPLTPAATAPVAAPVAALKTEPAAAPKPQPPAPAAEKTPSPVVESSLDEVILSYLMGDD
jgi:hypothetical protein